MADRLRAPVRHPRIAWNLTGIPIILIMSLFLGMGLSACDGANPRSIPPLSQRAYIWQRTWTPGLREVMEQAKDSLEAWVVLAAEVEPRASSAPRVARAGLDWAALRASGRPVGLALRVGPFGGPFSREHPLTRQLVELARQVLAEARKQGIEPLELQLDFDAATAKLDGYRIWLEALRQAIAPTPVIFTALPTWLDSPSFTSLVAAADGYVLQVHSLERPRDMDAPFDLCPPQAAKAAIAKAARRGRPFWVALPTYGYRAWFDHQGQFVTLAAEGPELHAGAGQSSREIRADPRTLAALVRDLGANHAESLRGLIWYRLPQSDDRLNWSWPTLRGVLQGREPLSRTELLLERPQTGLIEVVLEATGEADSRLNHELVLHWSGAQLLAADGLEGFRSERLAPDRLSLQPPTDPPRRLAPGQRLRVGWLRFDQPPEITAYEAKTSSP